MYRLGLSRTLAASVIVLLSIVLLVSHSAPISNPLIRDEDIARVIPQYLENRQRNENGREPFYLSKPVFVEATKVSLSSSEDPSQCPSDFRVRWITDVESSIYASPLVFPAPKSTEKLIFAATYLQGIEVINHEGFKPLGWPLSFEGSSFQGSPMLYDIDGDGNNDIGVVDKNANMYWIQVGEVAQYLEDFHVQVPRLKVKKDWYEGLSPDVMDNYVMLSMFDHKNNNMGLHDVRYGDESESAMKDKNNVFKSGDESSKHNAKLDELSRPVKTPAAPPKITKESQMYDFEHRRLLEDGESGNSGNEGGNSGNEGGNEDGSNNGDNEGLENNSNSNSHEIENENENNEVNQEEHENYIPDFGESGFDGYSQDDYIPRMARYGSERDAEGGDGSETGLGLGLGYQSHDDGFHYYMGGMVNDSTFVHVDPHVLSTPALADVDGDGHVEVIMAVSYYFDAAEYANKKVDFDTEKYVAGGIACWDLKTQDWAWLVHLDLTTNLSRFKALIYASPTVADLDADGRMEVLVGTSMGLLYLLDGETGFVRRYFPMQFHEIQSQVAVGDIRGGPDLEILVGDMAGNLVCVNGQAEVLWSRQLSGSLPFTPTIGDVDGDGILDVVVVAVSDKPLKDGYEHHIWAVRGTDGEVLDGYPRALPKGAQISSPVLLVDLHPSQSSTLHQQRSAESTFSDANLPPWLQGTMGHIPAASPSLDTGRSEKTQLARSQERRGLHMVVPSHDGHVYILEGRGRCAERIDIGQHIYTTPVLDDVTGDGYLDLVVGTMNSQVVLIETTVPYHPMNAWNAFPKHRSNVFSHGSLGLSVPLVAKAKLTSRSEVVSSREVSVPFDIWDTRENIKEGEPTEGDLQDGEGDQQQGTKQKGRKYVVTITRGTNKMQPLFREEYSRPGRYVARVPLSPPEQCTLVVSMVSEHGLYFEDTVTIASGTKFFVWIKYLVLVPIALFSIPLLFMRKQ